MTDMCSHYVLYRDQNGAVGEEEGILGSNWASEKAY